MGIQQNHQILVIGAGNSRLSEEKYQDKAGMSYQQMDCRAMDFPEGIFSVVIDKATLDSILCGEGSTHNAQKTLQGVSQVLGPNGVFLCVSHGQPSYRLTYLQRPEFGWSVSSHGAEADGGYDSVPRIGRQRQR